METVLKAIADWIKGILTAGIMSNLSGLFDDVNTQVGNIAQQVGTKPSNFEPRVFAMIEALSRNVVLPIAGIILTFIACYELIEMITQHNNMAQFEPALIMRWIFKTAVSVWLISNTFDIVMAVFDITQNIGVAKQVKQIVDQGIQVAIVTGGGNFWRGRTSETIDRTKADQIGMLATVMNCIYVSDIFRHVGMKTEVFTPFVCGAFTSLFSKDAAVEALNEGKVIFFAGGTGHPYFSTDTGAVLRAIEIEADAMLLAKAIDGIYDSDPKVNPEAKKYDEISIQEIIDKKLMAVDLTASIMCLENKMPMLVFGLNEENSIVETMSGNFNGTKVTV